MHYMRTLLIHTYVEKWSKYSTRLISHQSNKENNPKKEEKTKKEEKKQLMRQKILYQKTVPAMYVRAWIKI